MKKMKQSFSLLMVLAMMLTLLPVTAQASRPPQTVSVANAEDLANALSDSIDGDVIQLTGNITGSIAAYTGTAGKTITIDGQSSYAITGNGGDNWSNAALAFSGGGTVILKNITLQGGDLGVYSCGLYVTGGTSVQGEGGVSVIGGSGTLGSAGVYCDANTGGTVLIDIAKGGTANFANGGSYGAFSDAGTLIVTEATGGSNASGNSCGVACEGGSADVGTALGGAGNKSFGASCSGTGTTNVTTATGGAATAESTGVINGGYTSVVNVGTVTGNTYGVENTSADTGTINAGSAAGGTYDAYQTGGTINVATAAHSTTFGTVNTNTATLPLNKGMGASCVLDSITVAATGTTAVGTLPQVTKDGTAGAWYTNAWKTLSCGTTVDGSTVTALYSTFYQRTAGTVEIGSAAELTDALANSMDGDVLRLTGNITGSFAYTGTTGKTITIDGQASYTITAADDTQAALSLSGEGTVILKNITLQGGTNTTEAMSAGLKTAGSIVVQSDGTVIAIGGSDSASTAKSCGIWATENSSVSVTSATGGTTTGSDGMSYGVYLEDAGYVSAETATGGAANTGAAMAEGNMSYGIFVYSGTADIGTAGGGAAYRSVGAANAGDGTINVREATGADNISMSFGAASIGNSGTINVGTATEGNSTSISYGVLNSSNTSTLTGIINAGTAATASGTVDTDTAAPTLNKGTGASCVLDSITVAASGDTTVGTLPRVTKDGTVGTWYTDTALTTAFSGTTITAATTLYSSFTAPTLTTISSTVTLELDPKTGAVTAAASGGNISTTGDLTYTWNGGASGTGATATPTPGAETTCTVEGTNTTGSIEAKITVYKVTITALGAVEKDLIGAPALYGEAGDNVQIAYTLDKLGTLDLLAFSGAKNNPSMVMTAGSDKSIYTFDTDDVKSGIIALIAVFKHMYGLTVELNGGSGSPSGSMGMNGGYTVDINAGTKSGYTFSGWTSSNGVSFVSASSASTTFTMPYGDTTITASWTQSNTGGGGGGGSSTTSTPTVTTSTTGSGSNAVTTAGASITGTTSGGAQTASVPTSTMAGLTNAAKAAESSGGSAVAQITTGSGTGLASVGVTVPGAQFHSFASGTNAALRLATGLSTVTFSSGAVDAIGAAGSGDVAFTMGTVDASTLTAKQQSAVGDRPVYSFSVTVGGTAISAFGSDVAVLIPYTLGANENPNAIVVYYVDASGTLQLMQGKYDAATGNVAFKTTHFSDYVIGYNQVDFSDVADTAWYADAVTFLAARGVTSGTTSATFSPAAMLTRGQFITLLLKAYGVEAVANAGDNFSDAGDTYYTGYLAAAKQLGITGGVGGNRFAPGKAITRQEMFTLLYNTLKVLDKLPEGTSGKTLSDFTDSGSVASYAQEAMRYLVETGVVGGNNGLILPQSTTTRAQMAQVLYNLMSR